MLHIFSWLFTKEGDCVLEEMAQMLDLGIFTQFEKTIMDEREADFSKAVGKMFKES